MRNDHAWLVGLGLLVGLGPLVGCSLSPGSGLEAFGHGSTTRGDTGDAVSWGSVPMESSSDSGPDPADTSSGGEPGTSGGGAAPGSEGSDGDGADTGAGEGAGPPAAPGPAMPQADCDDLSTHVQDGAGVELHVFGAYESGSNGAISLSIDRVGVPLAVALVAYEPVAWTLELADDVDLAQVVLTGYGRASVSGHGDAFVTDGSGLGHCAMQWPGDAECPTQDLVDWATMVSGAELVSFAGCYAPASFTLH